MTCIRLGLIKLFENSVNLNSLVTKISIICTHTINYYLQIKEIKNTVQAQSSYNNEIIMSFKTKQMHFILGTYLFGHNKIVLINKLNIFKIFLSKFVCLTFYLKNTIQIKTCNRLLKIKS